MQLRGHYCCMSSYLLLIPTPIYIYEQVCSGYEEMYRSSSYGPLMLYVLMPTPIYLATRPLLLHVLIPTPIYLATRNLLLAIHMSLDTCSYISVGIA